MLYTLNLHSAVCQLYFNKTRRKENSHSKKALLCTKDIQSYAKRLYKDKKVGRLLIENNASQKTDFNANL